MFLCDLTYLLFRMGRLYMIFVVTGTLSANVTPRRASLATGPRDRKLRCAYALQRPTSACSFDRPARGSCTQLLVGGRRAGGGELHSALLHDMCFWGAGGAAAHFFLEIFDPDPRTSHIRGWVN